MNSDAFIAETAAAIGRETADVPKRRARAKLTLAPKPTTPHASSPGAGLDDFHAYMPTHSYIFAPTRELWPASSVNSRIETLPDGTKPSAWLDQNRPVEQMTWCPGEPMIIRDRLVSDGGWIPRRGCSTFNLYRAPNV
jgi:hypothetical protein